MLPLGLNTEAAAAAVKAVKAKVDDYFARGRLAAFDPRSVNALNRDEKEYAALGAKDLTSNHADIASLPLAQVGATTPLPLTQGINPAWAGAIAALQTNKLAQPIWHLVSDSGSDDVNLFPYGQAINGMDLAVAGTEPGPLQPGVMYRLFVAAGKAKGQLDFQLGVTPVSPSTNSPTPVNPDD